MARVRRRKEVPVELRESTPVRFTFEPRSRCYSFRQQLVPPWVRLELVDAGVDFVCEHFRGEPCMPNEFMGQVAAARPGAPVRSG